MINYQAMIIMIKDININIKNIRQDEIWSPLEDNYSKHGVLDDIFGGIKRVQWHHESVKQQQQQNSHHMM